MKRTLFTIAIVIACAAGASAQTEQGLMLVGGSVGFSSITAKDVYDGTSSDDETKITNIDLTPRFGYFVTDALAVGAGLELSSSTVKSGDYKQTESSFSFAPFARYYLPQGVFGQAEVGFGSSKTKFGESDSKSKLFLWSVGVGYAAFLNDNVAIEPLIAYGSRTDTDGDDSKYQEKFSGIMLNIGLSVYLGR